MRRTGMASILLAALLGATSGCGTMFNLAGEEVCLMAIFPKHPTTPFGGVDNDLIWMQRGPGSVVPAAVDMPFSLIGDVVTLPWTSYQYYVAAPRLADEKMPKSSDEPKSANPPASNPPAALRIP